MHFNKKCSSLSTTRYDFSSEHKQNEQIRQCTAHTVPTVLARIYDCNFTVSCVQNYTMMVNNMDLMKVASHLLLSTERVSQQCIMQYGYKKRFIIIQHPRENIINL